MNSFVPSFVLLLCGFHSIQAGFLYNLNPPLFYNTVPQPLYTKPISFEPELQHPQPLLSLDNGQLTIRSSSGLVIPTYQASPAINVIFIQQSLLDKLQQGTENEARPVENERVTENSPAEGPGSSDDTVTVEGEANARSRSGPEDEANARSRSGAEAGARATGGYGYSAHVAGRNGPGFNGESIDGDSLVGRK